VGAEGLWKIPGKENPAIPMAGKEIKLIINVIEGSGSFFNALDPLKINLKKSLDICFYYV